MRTRFSVLSSCPNTMLGCRIATGVKRGPTAKTRGGSTTFSAPHVHSCAVYSISAAGSNAARLGARGDVGLLGGGPAGRAGDRAPQPQRGPPMGDGGVRRGGAGEQRQSKEHTADLQSLR